MGHSVCGLSYLHLTNGKNADNEQIFILDKLSLKPSVENIRPYNNVLSKRKSE